MFKALLLTKHENSAPQCRLAELSEEQLPDGDVTVDIAWSTLNYKDSLAVTGSAPVVRHYPMVPGIDLAGTVVRSSDARYQVGDEVVLNGWGLGENHWGGLAQKARVRADWLIPLPPGLSLRQAMAIGTAGYTAALCVMALLRHGLVPKQGPVLVTGANGGVGTIALVLLAQAGFAVHASTGRVERAAHLRALGATEVMDRAELNEPGRPLQKARWAAAVDCVGSHTLANVCASLREGGAVAACGLAQGMEFPATVAPFILRGVSLLGVQSVTAPHARRIEAWQRLSAGLSPEFLAANSRVIGLAKVMDAALLQLAGKLEGRVLVDVNRPA